MNRKTITLLLTLLLLAQFCFVSAAATGVIPNISRQISPTITFDDSTNVNKLEGKIKTQFGTPNPFDGTSYDKNSWVVYSGAIIKANGFRELDNGIPSGVLNYVAMIDAYDNSFIKSNNDNTTNSFTPSLNDYYQINDNGGLCYSYSSNSVDDVFDSCNELTDNSLKTYVGKGVDETLEHTFTISDSGAHKLILQHGLIVIAGPNQEITQTGSYHINPNSAKNVFKKYALNDLSWVTVSIPNAQIYSSAPSEKLLRSTGENPTIRETIAFTVKNVSMFALEVKDYSLNCPTNGNCTLDTNSNGTPLYNGFKIPSGESIIITGTIEFNTEELPLESQEVSLDLNYTIYGKDSCIEQGVPCIANSNPTTYDIGLIDQQNFQIKIKNKKEGSVVLYEDCVGADGTIGETGESIAPKINLTLGGAGEHPNYVDLFECDAKKIDFTTNTLEDNNYVYCTQSEFIIELAKKIDQIFALKTNGDANNLETLYNTFDAHIIEQDFNSTEISSTITNFTTQQILLENQFVETGGVFSGVPTDELEAKLNGLMNGIKFNTGLAPGNDTLDAGKYEVTIDLVNNNPEGSGLFNSNTLSPFVTINVSLTKIANPEYDWFFYKKNAFSGKLSDVQAQQLNEYTTNISNRGVILDYFKSDSTETINFYDIFAHPIIIGTPPSNYLTTKITRQMTNYLYNLIPTSHSAFNGKTKVTYWTAFASSNPEDGCISTRLGDKALPYNEPDKIIDLQGALPLTNLNGIEYSNGKMYWQTVFYFSKNVEFETKADVFGVDDFYSTSNIKRTLKLNRENAPYKLTDSNQMLSLFNHIKKGNICIAIKNERIESGNAKRWTLFWNEQKVLTQLNPMKKAITDANLCNLRNPPEVFIN